MASGPAAVVEAVEAVDWAIAGSYFEACNCEAICPCRSVGGRPGGRSTYGVCEFALSWHITRGHAGDVPLSWDVRGRCAFATDFDYRSAGAAGSDPRDQG